MAFTALLNGVIAAASVASMFSNWELISKQASPMNAQAQSLTSNVGLFEIEDCTANTDPLASKTFNDCSTYPISEYPFWPNDKYRNLSLVSTAFTVAGTVVALLTAFNSLMGMLKSTFGANCCSHANAKKNLKLTLAGIAFWVLSWGPFIRVVLDDEKTYGSSSVNYGPGWALSVIVCGLSMILAFLYNKESKAPAAESSSACCTLAKSSCWFSWATFLGLATSAVAVAALASPWETIKSMAGQRMTFSGVYSLWTATECDYTVDATGGLECQRVPIVSYKPNDASEVDFKQHNSVAAAFAVLATAVSAFVSLSLFRTAIKVGAGHKAALTCDKGYGSPVKSFYFSLFAVLVFILSWAPFTHITLVIDEEQQTVAKGRTWNYGPGFVLEIIGMVLALATAFCLFFGLRSLNVSFWFKKASGEKATLATNCEAAHKRLIEARSLFLALAAAASGIVAIFGNWETLTISKSGVQVVRSDYGLTTFTECDTRIHANGGLDCYTVMAKKWYGWDAAPGNQFQLENTTTAFTVIGTFFSLVAAGWMALTFLNNKTSYKLPLIASVGGIAFWVISWACYVRVFAYDWDLATMDSFTLGGSFTLDYQEGFAFSIIAWAFCFLWLGHYFLVVKKAAKSAAEAPKAVELTSAAAPAVASTEVAVAEKA